jgi:hypothetical protein
MMWDAKAHISRGTGVMILIVGHYERVEIIIIAFTGPLQRTSHNNMGKVPCAPSIYRFTGINGKPFRWGALPSGDVFKKIIIWDNIEHAIWWVILREYNNCMAMHA